MHTRAGPLPRPAHIILHGLNGRHRTARGEVGRVAHTPLVRSGPVLDFPVDPMILHHLFRRLQRDQILEMSVAAEHVELLGRGM